MTEKEALQVLKDLYNRKKGEKYPSLPAHALVPARFTSKNANGLTKCILKYFELKGVKAWRQGSEGRYIQGRKITNVVNTKVLPGKWIPGHNKGAADIAAIIGGQFWGIEVKMKDRQLESQRQWQAELEASGGKYVIVRSFAEFLQQVNC
jgi:hypothetical protein